MSDVWFVVAGFTGILGGLTVYAASLALRLRAARREADAQDGVTLPAERTSPRSE
jgi:hypothetical protein